MTGKIFDVSVDSEKKLAEAAQNLLDLCRTLIPHECLPGAMPDADKAYSILSSAVSLAVQSIYMADHLGSEKDRVKVRPAEMNAMLHGLAEGVGSCIGTSPSPMVWAQESVLFQKAMETALFRRGSDTLKRLNQK